MKLSQKEHDGLTILERARSDPKVRALLADGFFDLVLSDSPEPPDDPVGRLSFSVPAREFARGNDGSLYLLLPDGSVGFWSTDGSAGRIAESMEDFFTLLISCGDWQAFALRPAGADETWFREEDRLEHFAVQQMQQVREGAASLRINLEAQQETLSRALGVPLCSGLSAVLRRFYEAALREPRFTGTFREEDGSLTPLPGLIGELCSDDTPHPLPDKSGEPAPAECVALADRYGLTPKP